MPEKKERILSTVREIIHNRAIRRIFLVLPILAAAFIITDILIISLLAVLSIIVPVFLNHMGIKMLGIELVTLTTVLTALQIGSEAGAVAGLVLMAAHMVAGQFSGAYILWVIPSYAIAGFTAGMIGSNITMIGIGIAVTLNTVFTALTYIVSPPEALSGQIPHAVGNTVFNTLVFLYVAPWLLTIM